MSVIDLNEDRFKKLKTFTMHGVVLNTVLDSQVLGDCPFCGKENHFYINWEKLLWDCKVCTSSGNVQKFLEKINERNKKEITEANISALAADRGLPRAAFQWVELGYHGQYTLQCTV